MERRQKKTKKDLNGESGKITVNDLHNQVFALLQLHAGVDDAAKDTPRVVQVQVDLKSRRKRGVRKRHDP